MKFDCIIGNPPFNDETSSSSGRRRGTEKLHLRFLNLSINSVNKGGEVALICPATGWWTGNDKTKSKYINLGLRNAYRADKDGPAFDNAKIFNIGIFHLTPGSQLTKPEIDEFASEKQNFSLKDAFKFKSNCGEKLTELDKNKLTKTIKPDGKYKVWVTLTNNGFVDNPPFNDSTRGKWRVIFNHNYSLGKLGLVDIAGIDDYLSYSVSCFIVDNYEDARKLKKFLLENEHVKKIFAEYKKNPTNSGHYFTHIDGSQFKKGKHDE